MRNKKQCEELYMSCFFLNVSCNALYLYINRSIATKVDSTYLDY